MRAGLEVKLNTYDEGSRTRVHRTVDTAEHFRIDSAVLGDGADVLDRAEDVQGSGSAFCL